jgi:hypothetical protein
MTFELFFNADASFSSRCTCVMKVHLFVTDVFSMLLFCAWSCNEHLGIDNKVRMQPEVAIITLSPRDTYSYRFCPYAGRYQSRDSSVGIALGYGLDDRGSRFRFSAGAGNFSLHHRGQNGSGAYPASYPMGTKGSIPGGKAAGA